VRAVVVATGGLSIPKIGATDLGYRLAKQFDLPVVTPRPAWCR
jgi:predicted flavoprotein YhiN